MDQCPSVAEMREYLRDLLNDERAREIDAHVNDCRECEATLSILCDSIDVRDFVHRCGGILKDSSEAERLASIKARWEIKLPGSGAEKSEVQESSAECAAGSERFLSRVLNYFRRQRRA